MGLNPGLLATMHTPRPLSSMTNFSRDSSRELASVDQPQDTLSWLGKDRKFTAGPTADGLPLKTTNPLFDLPAATEPRLFSYEAQTSAMVYCKLSYNYKPSL